MSAALLLTLAHADDPALREVLHDNFDAHSAAVGVPSDFRPLVIRLERNGDLLGGLMARTGRGWLSIDLLALPIAEHGKGVGRRLVAMAEEEALRRGCTTALLYTVAYQAPGFYEKLGYREFGRLAHDDPRLTRIWLQKRLS